ncbi:MAG: peptidylprolyl isomerase [Lentisphaerae bacterium]|nr:peptidylprolyl isomerase [Lentisphaerota bacterium]
MTVKVNGFEITEEAIQYELTRLVDFYCQHMPREKVMEQVEDLRKRAKDQAIGAKLLMDNADRLDIKVSEHDIEERMAKMIENAGNEEKFAKILREQGLSAEMVKMSIRKGRRVDLLVEKITQDVDDPTEEEMRAHFKSHSDEYRLPDQALVQHILIRPQSESENDRETARSRLIEIKKRIEEDGADFADMAEAYSDCPSGKKTGGSLGWVLRGSMVAEFDRAAFETEEDRVSDVISTEVGMHIVRRMAFEKGKPAAYEAVNDKVRDFLRHARRGEILAAYVNNLKNKAVIEED